jgi:hypothetical protein
VVVVVECIMSFEPPVVVVECIIDPAAVVVVECIIDPAAVVVVECIIECVPPVVVVECIMSCEAPVVVEGVELELQADRPSPAISATPRTAADRVHELTCASVSGSGAMLLIVPAEAP